MFILLTHLYIKNNPTICATILLKNTEIKCYSKVLRHVTITNIYNLFDKQ